jgi:cell division protein FtsI/penicillin-binding protein 2
VVEGGTGQAAKIEGIDIAGKTGTAQKISSSGGYEEGKYIASFLGFFPVDVPKVIIGVFIDEPEGAYYGGVVAAPCFREMTKEIYAYLRLGEPLERIYMSSALVPLRAITD